MAPISGGGKGSVVPPPNAFPSLPPALSAPPSSSRLPYQEVVSVAPFLFCALLVALFLLVYWCRRRRRAADESASFPTASHLYPAYEQGLGISFRRNFPIFPFDESFATSIGSIRCAVCLDDYEMGVKVTKLPRCKHTFHVNCINEWLSNNFTCPICRTYVLRAIEEDNEEALKRGEMMNS